MDKPQTPSPIFFNKLKIQDLSLKGKRVLIRVDFNVPLKEDGTVADPTRIKESLPTIRFVLDHGGKVILMSHLGRPNGQPDPKFSLKPCAKVLSHLLNQPVSFATECIGIEAENQTGEVILLENLRFHAAEEDPKSDPSFAKKLSRLGDFYVNDAFGTAHRAHSSTATITSHFPGRAAAGLLMQKEISSLGTLLSHPKHPFYAIIGGAKVSSKIGVLKALLDKVDGMFIGGGMAYTFFKAQGKEIGDSLCEDKQLEGAKAFLIQAAEKKIPLYFPLDLVVAHSFAADAQAKTITGEIPKGWQGMDIGPQTLSSWEKILSHAKTIFWNGPVGVFEFPRFAHGTQTLAKILSTLDADTVVGGGDSVAALQKLNILDRFSHVSTGGGASLEFIEYGHLPGIDALSPSQITEKPYN